LTTGDYGTGLSFITFGNYEAGGNTGTTTYFQNLMFNYTTGQFPLFWAQTDPWTGIVAPARGSTWGPPNSTNGTAGVVGGIPARTSPVCASLTSSATTSQINSAISSCSSSGGGVVELAAGTYSSATGGISFGSAHNVTLRGAGANQTIFTPTSEWTMYNGSNCYQGVNNCTLTSWTPGGGVGGANPFTLANQYPVGTNTIILGTGSNLSVGNDLIIDQADPTTDYGAILVSQLSSGGSGVSPGFAGPYTSQGMDSNTARGSCHGGSPCYSQGQTVTVVSCNGVTTVGASCAGSNVTVGISPGLELPNWGYDYGGNSLSPGAWWPASQSQGDGIEDLGLNMSGASGPAISFLFAQNCWVKGVAITNGSPSDNGLIQVDTGHHIEVRNNYIFGGVVGSTGVYGIEFDDCFDCLAENNIIQGVSTPAMFNGPASNTVWGYNYFINGYYTNSLLYNVNARGDHGSGIAKNLNEGNITNGHTQDTIHGTANLETDFRNNFWGTYPVCANSSSYTGAYGQCTQNMVPESIQAFHRFANVVGNILGTSGVETTYSSTSFVTGSGPYPIYEYGGQTVNPPDTNVPLTAMAWGNADPVTGFATPRFNCSDINEGTAFSAYGTTVGAFNQSLLYNPCPLANTLPASFYYTSQPSWWPSGKPWPIIGPDVTGGNVLVCTSGTYERSLVVSSSQCAGGTSSTWANGYVYSNPAMDCYLSLGGLPDGTGSALTNFNESSCYVQTGSTGPPAPQPPTNLSATVN
jgi:hypothetical protein